MKKMLFITALVSLLTSSVLAGYIGTVSKVQVKTDGNSYVFITLEDGTTTKGGLIDPSDPDAKKAIIALALTAQSQGSTVNLTKTAAGIVEFSITK